MFADYTVNPYANTRKKEKFFEIRETVVTEAEKNAAF